jgi:hypothetical protein
VWWQEEIPPPGPNQIINPEYLNKREELEQTWSQLHRQNNASNQYYRWTNTGYNRGTFDNRAFIEATRLERELTETPMYVEQGAPPAPEPEPASEIILKY